MSEKMPEILETPCFPLNFAQYAYRDVQSGYGWVRAQTPVHHKCRRHPAGNTHAKRAQTSAQRRHFVATTACPHLDVPISVIAAQRVVVVATVQDTDTPNAVAGLAQEGTRTAQCGQGGFPAAIWEGSGQAGQLPAKCAKRHGSDQQWSRLEHRGKAEGQDGQKRGEPRALVHRWAINQNK